MSYVTRPPFDSSQVQEAHEMAETSSGYKQNPPTEASARPSLQQSGIDHITRAAAPHGDSHVAPLPFSSSGLYSSDIGSSPYPSMLGTTDDVRNMNAPLPAPKQSGSKGWRKRKEPTGQLLSQGNNRAIHNKFLDFLRSLNYATYVNMKDRDISLIDEYNNTAAPNLRIGKTIRHVCRKAASNHFRNEGKKLAPQSVVANEEHSMPARQPRKYRLLQPAAASNQHPWEDASSEQLP